MDQTGGEGSKDQRKEQVDEELSKLLDSSLQDFGKDSTGTPDNQSTSDINLDAMGASASYDREAAQRAATEFQQMLRQLSDMQKVMVEQVKAGGEHAVATGAGGVGPITAAAAALGPAGVASGGGSSGSAEEEAQMAQAFLQNLNFLAEKAQKIQEAGNEDEFEDAVRQLQSDGAYENEFLPFMQGLMSSLLSKETLYPSLKEMSDKYPPWLDENRSKLDAPTLERYETQLSLIREACKEFEEEKEDDPDDVKGQRFERLIVVMQKMQSCGQPPEDLVGSLPAGWAMDDQTGIPRVVDQEKAAETCSIM